MRTAETVRNTAETKISLRLNLDGSGENSIDSGCGFLNHMLTLFSRHGGFDLELRCVGDTDVEWTFTTPPRTSASAWDAPFGRRWAT